MFVVLLKNRRYIDDHAVMSAQGGSYSECQRFAYAFSVLKTAIGGYWWGTKKCDWEPKRKFELLGLIVDTVDQCFRVTPSKKEKYTKLINMLHSQLDNGEVSLRTLAGLAGLTVYLTHAIPHLRSLQNCMYSVLSDCEEGLSTYETRRPLWWEWCGGADAKRSLNKETTRFLRAEIDSCDMLIKNDRAWAFVHDRHVTVEHMSDARPQQAGTVIRLPKGIEQTGSPRPPEVIFGGTLPLLLDLPEGDVEPLCDIDSVYRRLLVRSIDLSTGNIGLAEGAALVVGLQTVDAYPHLRARYENARVDFLIDNNEVLWLMRSGRARGEHRYEKMLMLYAVRHYEIKFNMCARYHYVASKENDADAPSRDEGRAEIRTHPDTVAVLKQAFGPFTLDWMATSTTVIRRDNGTCCRYYSREYDPRSQGINVLAHDVNVNHKGERESGFCNPPFCMLPTVTRWGEHCRAKVVLIHPKITEPKPTWARRLNTGTTMDLPLGSTQRRIKTAWKSMEVELQATQIDWGLH